MKQDLFNNPNKSRQLFEKLNLSTASADDAEIDFNMAFRGRDDVFTGVPRSVVPSSSREGGNFESNLFTAEVNLFNCHSLIFSNA